MNYLKETDAFSTRKNIINNAGLSTYMPPRVVLSSQISRKDLNSNNLEETEYEKHDDDVDELFENLNEQLQNKIRQYSENKDTFKINKPSTNKANNFVGEFLQVKRNFEADFAANTRIYQNLSQNNDTIKNYINNEDCKLQMSSADKYVAMLQSQKTAPRDKINKIANKYYSLQTQNWVPGALITKIKNDSDCNFDDSGGSIKNQELLQHSVVNEQEKRRNQVKNGQLYGLTYNPVQASKRVKSKKKSFVEEFCEMKDKLAVTPKKKIKNQEEHLESLKAENEKGETLGSNLKQKQGTEEINNKIITPFGSIRTSFFSNNNPFETLKSNRKKKDNAKDFTADWVKGKAIVRGEKLSKTFIDSKNREHTSERMEKLEDLYYDISPSYVLQNNESIEEKSDINFTPRNDYSRMSPSFTPVNNTNDTESRKRENIFKNKDFCTSAITMSTVQYSNNRDIHRPNCVITETKVTKFMFPSNQINLFQNPYKF